AVDQELLEIPAGLRDVEGEPPAATARRELEEEVGMRAGRLEKLAEFYNSAGFSDERSFVFMALDLEPGSVAAQGMEKRQRVDADAAWGAEVVVKVKEPQPDELARLRPDLILFTYLHLAAYPDVARALLDAGTTGLAYETVQLDSGTLPLLAPMSEVAGRMAT